MRLSRRARSDCKTIKISALEMLTREFGVSVPTSSADHLIMSGRSTMPLVADDTLSWRRSALSDASSTPLKPSRPITDNDLLAKDMNPDSMRSAISLAVCIGQCFSLLPINTRTRNDPRFRWCSVRVLYTLLVTTGLFINMALTTSDNIQKNVDTSPIVAASVFYLSATLVSILYVRLALRWRSLSLSFLRVEHRMSTDGFPPHLRLRLNLITILVLFLALVEYALSQIKVFMGMDLRNKPVYEVVHDYYNGNFGYMGLITPYHPTIALICVLLNIMATFMWNYNDVFIMLVSVAIAQRFKLLNSRLLRAARKEKSESYWMRARETYNDLAHLTRDADNHLSPHVLFSFVSNLFFICLQLLHTVSNKGNTIYQNTYFIYSFGFLLLRTCSVSLFAATIHDESKAIKRVLYTVPSRSYCVEVDRFLAQATTDDIALTGMKFFNVTRSFLLTMAGTIATYEIVLVQFNAQGKD